MAYIVCSNCRHKTIKPTQRTTCPACGTAFIQQIAGPGPAAPSASNAGQPRPASNPPVPYGQYGHQQQQQWSPTPFQQPAPMPTPFNQPIPIKQGGPINTTSYPKGFPHRLPDITGKLITFDKDTIDIPTDWSHTVLRVIFFPFIFPILMKNFFGTNPQAKQTMTVYRIQVELSPGDTRSALLKGDLQRDKPRLGQRVAFWGTNENGVLTVSHGYNEDTKAEISATYPGLPMLQFTRVAAITVPVLLALLLLCLLLFFPTIIPLGLYLIGQVIGAIIGIIIAGIVLYFVISAFLPWLPKKLVTVLVYILLLFALLTLCSSMLARIH